MANWSMWVNHIIGKGYVPYSDISKLCNNYSWSCDKDSVGISLTFDSILDLAEGRAHFVLKKDSKKVISGIVTKKQQKKNSSSYTAQDYSLYLNQDQAKVYQFNNLDAKSCIYNILNDIGVGGACITLNTKINKLYWGKTYIDIIKDIVGQCSSELGEDVVMEMRDTVLWIDKISNLKLSCKYIMANDYSVDRSMEEMKNYIVVSNNATDGAAPTILATVKDDNSVKIFGRMSKILTVDGQNEAQARTTGQSYLNNFNATRKETTVSLLDIEGCEEIRANRKLYIDINKYGVKGDYKVKNAQHTVKNSIHKVQATIDFSGASFEDPTTASTATTTNTKSSSSSNNAAGTASSKADQIIAYAKTFLGIPYVWGGKTPSGFDCSGFVSYVFAHFGISLTAYTFDMINEGTRITVQQAAPGDILFFYNTDHVGIYIGNDQFIHAPHTGDVVKISQFSGSYANVCNAAIRVL